MMLWPFSPAIQDVLCSLGLHRALPAASTPMVRAGAEIAGRLL